jgi:hypothetical protein
MPHRANGMNDKSGGQAIPLVSFAWPVLQPWSRRHSLRSSGPAARWIAPSTPPPPRSEQFAALTMASTARVVMSVLRIAIRKAASLIGTYSYHSNAELRQIGFLFGCILK